MQLIFFTLFAFNLIRRAVSYIKEGDVIVDSYDFSFYTMMDIANITDKKFLRGREMPELSAEWIRNELAFKYSNGTWICVISEPDTYYISMPDTGIFSINMSMSRRLQLSWPKILVIHIPALEPEVKYIEKECPAELPCLPANNPSSTTNQEPATNQEATTKPQPTTANSAFTNRLSFCLLTLLPF
uniref:Uncharacterized protein n=1 Tax=Ditylenchus dipsaci TaxID=166011 RepID=A0A915ESJ0_9BILA